MGMEGRKRRGMREGREGSEGRGKERGGNRRWER